MTEKGSHEPRKRTIEPVSVESEASVSASLTISMRPYFSDYHLRSAAYFAKQSAGMEREYAGKPRGDVGDTVFYGHRACVIGAILSSAAFLEAAINELFVDSVEHEAKETEPTPTDPPRPVDQLPRASRKVMAEVWPFDVDRQRPLDKYQIALVLSGKPELDTSARPYQDVDALVTLRNNLVHYKPRDIRAGLEPGQETEKMAKRLRDRGFAPNPFFSGSGNPFFPDKCLGYGCAKWAVESSVEFADAFFSRMSIVSRHERFKPLDIG